MGTWKLKLFASDMPEDPTNASADKGEYEFNVLRLRPIDTAVSDVEYKADGALDNRIIQRAKFDINLVPFFIATERFSGQQGMDDLMLLKKMLKQPYLVIKSCDLPPWDVSANITTEYPLPAIVRWNFEIDESVNEEIGEIELSFELEYLYVKGQTQPTPTTDASTYAY